MYAAHFAASLGFRAAAPQVPIVALLLAGVTPDLAFALLMQSGVERIEAPIGAPYAHWRIVAPYSHGVIIALGSVLLLLMGLWLVARRLSAGAWIAALSGAALSHLVCDWCVDPGGLRLFASSTATSGLELWRSSPNVAMILELAVVGTGTWLFVRSAKAMSWTRRTAIFGVLGWLAFESTIGQGGAVLLMPSRALATPYLWQLVRDFVLVSVGAIVAGSTTLRVRSVKSKLPSCSTPPRTVN